MPASYRRANLTFKAPITVEDVLNSRMIAYPFRLLQCCLVTDGGGAISSWAPREPATANFSMPPAAAMTRAPPPCRSRLQGGKHRDRVRALTDEGDSYKLVARVQMDEWPRIAAAK